MINKVLEVGIEMNDMYEDVKGDLIYLYNIQRDSSETQIGYKQ